MWHYFDSCCRADPSSLVGWKSHEFCNSHLVPIALRPDDDLRLGRLLKSHGFVQDIVFGTSLVTVEWYASFAEMRRGLMKIMFAAAEYVVRVPLFAVFQIATMVRPFVAVIAKGMAPGLERRQHRGTVRVLRGKLQEGRASPRLVRGASARGLGERLSLPSVHVADASKWRNRVAGNAIFARRTEETILNHPVTDRLALTANARNPPQPWDDPSFRSA